MAVWQREKVGVELFFNEHPEWAQIGEEKEEKRERTKSPHVLIKVSDKLKASETNLSLKMHLRSYILTFVQNNNGGMLITFNFP